MIAHAVAADAYHLGALVGQLLGIVAEATGLFRAAAGQVGRVEVDHDHVLADVIARFPGLALVVGSLKVRRRVADLQINLLVVCGQKLARRQGANAQSRDAGFPPKVHAVFSLCYSVSDLDSFRSAWAACKTSLVASS